MNVASILDKRRVQWNELESLCDAMESRGRTDRAGGPEHRGAQGIARFSTLYRAACADLALADAYQLPPNTVTYLHQLVARAHNQLYRANQFEPSTWVDVLFYEAPRQIFADSCVRVATILFFGLFTLAMYMGYDEQRFPGFANAVMGETQLENLESMYEQKLNGSLDHYVSMAGFYINHNTGIGLTCFASGILIIPCLFKLAYNAVVLGVAFGYMARPDVTGGDNFFQFVTAHGPFELTAIALSAAAGLRLGVGWFRTGGLNRIDSLRRSAIQAIPVMAAAATMFVLAAFTEGFLSPSPLPFIFKAAWAIMSSGMISFYFVILGFPWPKRSRGSHSPRYESTTIDSDASGQRSLGHVTHAT
ncbi:stage II sporulation protein M [Novipirellula caenicola]|uniref:Stage II sporulation protein M n=1 Tax=Novipirellula caenicola TaxID=1536901 RepID=A0ABP9VJD8_9BACT